ncbi:O-acetyltransferase OatA [Halioglobus japonicus]|nr:O-acetyltransferase OatA [Halioglobus japonicus]
MTTNSAPRRAPLFPYYPALDGLRGYFAIAVLLHHFSGNDWFSGALLLMSGFFVLSGFLIASLLVAEHERDGRIDIGNFLIRRAKRLLPASILTIIIVAVMWNLFELRFPGGVDPAEVRHNTNMHLLASVFYVQNWHAATGPVWATFGAYFYPGTPGPSPVGHFWSLAVEEQFYLVFPFIAVLSLGLLGGRRALGVVIIAGLMLSIGLQPTIDGTDGMEKFYRMTRIYVGTDVRAAEFLIGALMAVFFSYPAIRQWITTSRWVTVAGIAALIFVTYWVFTEKVTSYWLFERGGFAKVGVVFVPIIFALTQARGVLIRLLDISFLRWIGERSYGMYVYHSALMTGFWRATESWPVIARVILLVVLTVIISGLSYTYFEQPIRRGYKPWQRKEKKLPA